MTLTRRQTRRRGLSLLEVLVALAIFFVALVAISQIVEMSGRRAEEVLHRAEAAQLCQSKLAEIASGALELTGGEISGVFDEDPSWEWVAEVAPLSQQNGSLPASLLQVTVRVTKQQARPPYQYTVSQWVLDPAARGSTQDAVTAAATDAAGTDGSTTPAGGTTTTPQAGATTGR
jgi:prepilin-type N-terminal cleavage/methylation domain-containing protein